MGAGVGAIIIKERHLVDAFARAGATSASTAVHPSDIAVDLGGVGGQRVTERASLR
jgi:hypothetical protein